MARGTFQGNLQGTPSRPLEMLTSSKAVTASYAETASRLGVNKVGDSGNPVYFNNGIPVADSKTKGIVDWVTNNSGSISGVTGSSADVTIRVNNLEGKSGSWDSSSKWVGDNSASLLNPATLIISKSLGVPSAGNISYNPFKSASITIAVPSTPGHIGAAPANHTHSTSQVNGLDAFTASVKEMEAKTESWDGKANPEDISGSFLPLAGGTITGDLVVNNNLTVKGTTVSIDAQNLNVKDKLILVASGSNTRAAADGAGIAVPTASAGEGGAARIQYDGTANVFTSSVGFKAPSFTGNVTGNLTGTASFATSASKAISSSYANTATSASEATHAVSASEAVHAITASHAVNAKTALTASYLEGGASIVVNTASYAKTASVAHSASSVAWNNVSGRPGFYVATFQTGAFTTTSFNPTGSNATIKIPSTTTHITGLDAVTASVKQMVAKSASWDNVANTASAAYTAASQALATASVAQKEAESASYWKTEASKSAASASTFKTTAQTAATQANAASQSAKDAASAANTASGSAKTAATVTTNWSLSASNAASAANVASQSAKTAATTAQGWVTSASKAAQDAEDYRDTASGSMEDARFYSSQAATNATLSSTYAVQSSASAQLAAASASSAATYATRAQQSASNAHTSKTSAAASASAAATYATQASQSAYTAAQAVIPATTAANAASASAKDYAASASASASLMFKNVGSTTQPVFMSASVGPVAATPYESASVKEAVTASTVAVAAVNTNANLPIFIAAAATPANPSPVKYDTNLTYNASTNRLNAPQVNSTGVTASVGRITQVTATGVTASGAFRGALIGNVTGNLTGTASFATSASRAISAESADNANSAASATTASYALVAESVKDGAGLVVNTASYALDAAIKYGGHYTPSASGATAKGSTAARTYLKTVSVDGKGHVVGFTTGSESNDGVTSIAITTASNYVTVDNAAAVTSTGTRKIDLSAATKGKVESGSAAHTWITANSGNISSATSSAHTHGNKAFLDSVESKFLPITGGTVTGDVAISANKNLTVGGNLYVNGTASYVNTQDLVVKDKLVLLSSGSTTQALANGAGIAIQTGSATTIAAAEAAAARFQYRSSDNKFTASVGIVAPDFTGNLTGTASYATSASRAVSAASAGSATTATTASYNKAGADALAWITANSASATTNTDRYVNTAAFASTGSNGANGVKMTLTRAGSDTATVVATIPVASTTAAGVMTGAQVTNLNGAVASGSLAKNVTAITASLIASGALAKTAIQPAATASWKAASDWVTANSSSALTKYHPLSGTVGTPLVAQNVTSSNEFLITGAASVNHYFRVNGSQHQFGFGIGTENANRGIYQFSTGSGGTSKTGWLLLWDNTYTASFLSGYRVKADGFIGSLQGNVTGTSSWASNAVSSTTASMLQNNGISNPNSASVSHSAVKWFACLVQASGYAGTNYGFPATNNANGILWLGTHPGYYGHQLGFSSTGRIYDRYISAGSFPTTSNGGSWKTILNSDDTASWAAAAANSHTHSNKAVLDGITAADTASWDGKWTYNEATIKAVKVNSASRADSAASATSATTATKLVGTSGSTSIPVYINAGVPTACAGTVVSTSDRNTWTTASNRAEAANDGLTTPLYGSQGEQTNTVYRGAFKIVDASGGSVEITLADDEVPNTPSSSETVYGAGVSTKLSIWGGLILNVAGTVEFLNETGAAFVWSENSVDIEAGGTYEFNCIQLENGGDIYGIITKYSKS